MEGQTIALKVVKFGGSSLATGDDLRRVCDLIGADPARRLVVVSAPGRRHPKDTKVTDLLIALGERRLSGDPAEAQLQVVVQRYADLIDALGMDPKLCGEIEADLRTRMQHDRAEPEGFMDAIKSAGEDNCARLVARYLTQSGLEARYVDPCEAGLVVSREHGRARVLPKAYEHLAALRERTGITVLPGFFGCTPGGELVTFARGGSDITGAVLAAAVKADVYENFTDVDGVFAASPAIIKAPRLIEELTYREMRELAYAGFVVLHDEALRPVYRAHVPVHIRNTRRPEAPGTRIVPQRSVSATPVVGIACDPGFCRFYVGKYLMNREIGFGRKLLEIFEEEELSFEHSPTGIDSISVIVRQHGVSPSVEARIVERIRDDLEAEEVIVERDLALLTLVGEGMENSPGIASRATGALARAGVNIELISTGSEVTMIFGLKAAEAHHAARVLYGEFFGEA